MSKADEIRFPSLLGEAGSQHAIDKPFSDAECGLYLSVVGAIMQLLPRPPARLLDLGVGPGWTSVMFAKQGYAVVGLDISPQMIELANAKREQWRAESVEFRVGDFESVTAESEFDCAVFHDALHHAENEITALERVFRALKPGGVCVTAEPGVGHSSSEAARQFAATYGVTEKDMPPQHIIDCARRIGFRHFEVFERPSAPHAAWSDRTSSKSATRLSVAKALLTRGFRCAIWGPHNEELAMLGHPTRTTMIHHNIVRLWK
jgi:SAM-dependent methyltransferase